MNYIKMRMDNGILDEINSAIQSAKDNAELTGFINFISSEVVMFFAKTVYRHS